MSWITLQVIAMFLISANSIVDKRLVRDHERSPIIYLASFAIVGLPVAAVGIWVVPWHGIEVAGIGLLTGLIFTVMVLLYYRAMSLEDVSRLIPVLRLSEVLKLMLLAVFLNDRLTPAQYLASAFMMLGTIALAWKAGRPGNDGRICFSKGIALMGLVALLQAFNGLLDSHLNLMHSPWVLVVWSNVGIVLGTSLVLLSHSQRAELRRGLAETSRRFQMVIIVEQVGRLVAGLLSDFAVWEVGSAALMSVLGGARPLFVMALATLFLGERLTRQEALPKLAGIGLMGIGTGLLISG